MGTEKQSHGKCSLAKEYDREILRSYHTVGIDDEITVAFDERNSLLDADDPPDGNGCGDLLSVKIGVSCSWQLFSNSHVASRRRSRVKRDKFTGSVFPLVCVSRGGRHTYKFGQRNKHCANLHNLFRNSPLYNNCNAGALRFHAVLRLSRKGMVI
jgi:hypothetical protein